MRGCPRERAPTQATFAEAVLGDLAALEGRLSNAHPSVEDREVGWVRAVSHGVAIVDGLPGAKSGERIVFRSNARGGDLGSGVVTDLAEDRVGVVLVEESERVAEGARAERTGQRMTVPVGVPLMGRIMSPLGIPLDGAGPIRSDAVQSLERPAPPLLERAPVSTPLHTGVTVVDALLPIGRGQRELILGDRQTGKSSLALTAVLAQRGTGVRCVWCSIGQRGTAVAQLVATLRCRGALAYTTVVVAPSDAPPGVRWIAPFAAMSVAESWMEGGHDVLLVLDDLTQHARAYREVALLLRRPPAREAYPGDVFHVHARLLERGTCRAASFGGGSLTVLPILETFEQNLSSFIPTNLISICDGQLVLSADLAARGIQPAVDVGRSVSRVGGKAQQAALRAVAGPVRLDLAQFAELERFARFGVDLDAATRAVLRRGHRLRAVLQQPALEPVPERVQLGLLFLASDGVLDDVPDALWPATLEAVRVALEGATHLGFVGTREDRVLSGEERAYLRDLARSAAARVEAGA